MGGRPARSLLPLFQLSSPLAIASGPYVRHVGLQPFANSLRVFSTQKLVAPEHIRMGVVSLDSPWTSWSVGTTVEIIRPQTALRRRE